MPMVNNVLEQSVPTCTISRTKHKVQKWIGNQGVNQSPEIPNNVIRQ